MGFQNLVLFLGILQFIVQIVELNLCKIKLKLIDYLLQHLGLIMEGESEMTDLSFFF